MKRLWWGLGIVVVIAGALYFFNRDKDAPIACTLEAKVCSDGSVVGRGGPQCEFSPCPGPLGYRGEVIAGGTSPLLDFVREDYEEALASDRLVMLFFFANWCPTCSIEVPELYAAFDALERDDVIGFRVNYRDDETDTFEEELAQEFGVAYQHTKIFIKDGERILKTPEMWPRERYLEEIENLMKTYD